MLRTFEEKKKFYFLWGSGVMEKGVVCVCVHTVCIPLYGILSNGKPYRPIIMTITSLLCLAYLYDFI